MQEIRGNAKNLRDLLSGSKFAIDYYQREYRWEQKQVLELIEDLAEQFSDHHDHNHERSEVEKYGHYFLGSIIISDKDSKKFIIDGQQRITTLTLLLTYLYRELNDDQQRSQLSDLIFSQKYGKRSFNLDVPERVPCMEALFQGEEFHEDNEVDSVINILQRYSDIEEHFPEELSGDALPYFADWLIENVYLVEITAYSDRDAYTIFETMNDRGLSLSPTDMLKGYLLANIDDSDLRGRASNAWRSHISRLRDLGKEEDADAIKAWLRSQHAESIRETKRGAEAEDFDLIGTEFHRWVRDQEQMLGLKSSAEFSRFIQTDFSFYAHWYENIRKSAITRTKDLEEIFYNAEYSFTFQYPLLLAPLKITDDEAVIHRKLQIVSRYVDSFIHRRIWNYKSFGYSTVKGQVFSLIKEIRGLPEGRLIEVLTDRLEQSDLTFEGNDRFTLTGMNKKYIRRILARMTEYIETGSGRPSRYEEYVARGKAGHDVEHIWANHAERHKDEFDHPADFLDYRNRIGGLLLLPKKFNQSYGDMEYEQKLEQYLKQNLLALSLHSKAYERDPGFLQFIETSGLPLKAHSSFRTEDLDARQALYTQMAEQIWSPHRLRVMDQCDD